MSKLLFWIVIILVALVVARLLAQKAARGAPPTPSSRHQHPPGTRPGTKGTPGTELMVRCAHCGIQLPSDEAVRRKGYNYCGLAHSLRGPKS
jgi:uncharacterized protein